MQIVGNVSLSRAPGSRQRYIICNIVVHDQYRRQGIGRRLTEAAIAEAKELGAEGVVLQVHQDNLPALRLYTSLGFQEAAGETELRLQTMPAVAVLDAPGYVLRPWRAADGQAVYHLAQLVTPLEQQWFKPVKAEDYQPDWWTCLGRQFTDWLAGREVHRLTALKGDRLIAMLTVTAALRRGSHQLALLVHPDHAGCVEAALVSRALHMLVTLPPRPTRVQVAHADAEAVKVLQDYGFAKQRTLLTMRKDFYE